MKVTFLEEAEIELDDAIEYYNSTFSGLGDQFLEEVLSAIKRIVNFPDAWHPLSDEIRRCQTKRFPYGVIYAKLENEILIIAVSNLHRRPEYWDNRYKSI